MNERCSRLWLLLCLFFFSGCGKEGTSSAQGVPLARTAPAVRARSQAWTVSGTVPSAPPGTEFFLFAAQPPGADLRAWSGALLDRADLREGRFLLTAPEGFASPLEVLVSAPGRALVRRSVSPGEDLSVDLPPEAVLTLGLRSPRGEAEEDALALVFDAQSGAPLPLPAPDLVSGADGSLRATRLPAGRFEVLVTSGDGARWGRLDIELAAGERVARSLTLQPADELELRFLERVGAPVEDLLKESR
ncbi:MAG: hypothetical protein D6731_15490 [Planctomycetota bacterium]|nr:MAG: hypothetical protein D6731_15490 [Planctomycetota bacterium]